MKAIILIGGLGTRLRPLTCSTPKPLLPIVNRAFLEYQFELMKRHGIREVVLCVAYLSHEFENYFGSGRRFGVKLHYVHEKEPLGTGGAIRNAERYIDGPVLVFNGDILSDIDITGMRKYHRKNNALVTIGLTRVKDPTIYGLVETDRSGKIERFLEKPSWDEVTCNTINAGIYLFEPDVIKSIPRGINFSVERGLFPDLLRQGLGLYGYSPGGYWLDIGTIDKYMQAHFDIMDGAIRFSLPGKKRNNILAGKNLKMGRGIEVEGKLVCGNDVTIGDYVQLQGNVCLGDGVTIGRGTAVIDSIVHDNTKIHEGVRLEKTILGKDCLIEANAVLNCLTTLGNGTVIRKYSRL